SVRRDIEIIKQELPVDLLEFFILTPLPGSEDHKVLWTKGIAMHPDLNLYESEHVVTGHAKMTQEEWERAYAEAWRAYYTPAHVETILRRARASGADIYRLMLMMVCFATAVSVEKVHPLQAGILRLKNPAERRPGLPVEPAWTFYPRLVGETLAKLCRLAAELWRIARIFRRVAKDPNGLIYTDLAMTPVATEEMETLGLFTQNKAARDAVDHARKIEELIRGVA